MFCLLCHKWLYPCLEIRITKTSNISEFLLFQELTGDHCILVTIIFQAHSRVTGKCCNDTTNTIVFLNIPKNWTTVKSAYYNFRPNLPQLSLKYTWYLLQIFGWYGKNRQTIMYIHYHQNKIPLYFTTILGSSAINFLISDKSNAYVQRNRFVLWGESHVSYFLSNTNDLLCSASHLCPFVLLILSIKSPLCQLVLNLM